MGRNVSQMLNSTSLDVEHFFLLRSFRMWQLKHRFCYPLFPFIHHPSIHPSIHPFSQPASQPASHLFIHPAVHSSTYPFIHLSVQHLCTESVYAKHSSKNQRLSNKEDQEEKSRISEAFILVSHNAINKINQQSL